MLKRSWNIVLSLPNGLSVGGMTTWALRTAAALAGRGWRIVIVAHEPASSTTEFDLDPLELPKNVRILRQPSLTSDVNWERNLRAYARLLPAVIIPTTIEQSFEVAASLAMASPSMVRIIGWNHSDHEYDYSCLRHLEPACERFVTNTSACTTSLTNLLPQRRDDIALLPHIVSIDNVPTAPSNDAGPIRIGYAGRLEDTAKRVTHLVAIAERLRAASVAYSMRIMGDGPLRSQLEARIDRFDSKRAEQSVACEIRLLSPSPPNRMHEFWRDCDCLLLPSAYEGLNFQMLEAMAHGCVPIVSAIASGPADLIEHSRNGLVFPVSHVDAAADCIRSVANDRMRLRRLGSAAREAIVQRCNPTVTIERLDALLDAVIEAPPRPWPRTRAVSLRASSGLGSAEFDAVERMRSTLRSLAARGCRAIAVYGAGRHSRSIAAAFADAPIEIRAFIDDDPALQGQFIWNWPVVSREAACESDIGAVVISSRMNESQLLHHSSYFAEAGIELIPVYSTDAITSATAKSMRVFTSDTRASKKSLKTAGGIVP